MYTNFKYEVSVILQARLFPMFSRLLFPLSLRSRKFDILHFYAHDPSLWVGYVVRIVELNFVEIFGRKHIRKPLP